MASSPQLKVYRNGEYVASCKYAEDAAAIVGLSGTIRIGHNKIIWHEGNESQPASESYDFVAETIRKRIAGN
jgi:hypothetical protein